MNNPSPLYRKTLGWLALLLLATLPLRADAGLSRLYQRLDSLIGMQPRLTEEKNRQIDLIRAQLSDPRLTDAERFNVNNRLYEEYLAFKYDSAFKYVSRNIALAQTMGDTRRLNKSRLGMVHIAAVSGLFDEAGKNLSAIDPGTLDTEALIDYYEAYTEFYLFKAEFSQDTPYHDPYIDLVDQYRRKILEVADTASYSYLSIKANELCRQQHFDEAIGLLTAYLPKVRPGDRTYSVVTSTLAFFHLCKNDTEGRRRYLLLSAMSDLQGCIRENNAMRELSSMLFADGDLQRAYRYLNVSIEDATFYGTRLRNIQASQLLPQILSAYQTEQDSQHHRTRLLLAAISVIALLLVGGLVVIALLMKRYRRANDKVHRINGELNEAVRQLEQANGQMREGNKMKEEYIARFLDLCSTYIDKAEEQRKLENRLARDHKLNELYAELKSTRLATENAKLFYQNFDSAFLNIYPDFVEEVNRLLTPEGQIVPKEGETLTTELRILALIRLGISDNQKIASILRSSITTIYTYRSKLKGRSIARDDFEERVKGIGAYA